MRCPNHPDQEVTGYCSVCGRFGCPQCLTEHEGQALCEKHYRPIAKRIEEDRKHETTRKKHPRQLLVIRCKDGGIQHGVCFALNTKDAGFHLDLVDETATPLGETQYIDFKNLKAVFFVKSFDGNFDKTVRYKEWTPEGAEIIVKFQDGEVVRGFSLRHYDPNDERFHLIPDDPNSNNISILVEQSAVETVYTPEEYEAEQAKERESRKDAMPEDLTQEESAGDFYLGTKNYEAALGQYQTAHAKHPHSRRLLKKLALAQYNVGVQFIKKRDYPRALAHMEKVLEIAPGNEHAQKKVFQLQRILEKQP